MASSASEPVFVSAVRQTLSEWKSFQLAVDNGMGGIDTNDKLLWMVEVIAQFFIDNSGLFVGEVSGFVAEIIDNEFNTVIEDGSLEMFASSLCWYYELCNAGREGEVMAKLSDIRTLSASRSEAKANRVNEVEEQMSTLSIDNEGQQTDGNDEGWTLVQRKCKR